MKPREKAFIQAAINELDFRHGVETLEMQSQIKEHGKPTQTSATSYGRSLAYKEAADLLRTVLQNVTEEF